MIKPISVSDNILSEALLKYQIERIDSSYPSTEDCNQQFMPNKQTDKKINKLIRLEKKPYYVFINTIGKRVACIIISLLLAMTTTVFSVKALREPFINFIVETYEKFSTIIFNNSDNLNSESIALSEFYEPSYFPEGYTKTHDEKHLQSYFCEYSNENGDKIVFEQCFAQNTQVGIDTENATIEKIYVNNIDALFYENKGQVNVIFEDNSYAFFVSGNIKKTELIKVAESIKKIK